MEIAELAIVSTQEYSHLAPSVEFAKTLTSRDHRISVTFFITISSFESQLTPYTQSLLSNKPPPNMQFVNIGSPNEPTSAKFSLVKDFYSSLESGPRPKGFILDMFCTAFADLASELGVPFYMFHTSNTHSVCLLSYLQFLHDEKKEDFFKFKCQDTELPVPGFVNLVPSKVLPSEVFFQEIWSSVFVNIPRTFRKATGILVNSFAEIESYTIKSLSEDDGFPPIYVVGPVVNIKAEAAGSNGNKRSQYEEIMTWLDGQPPASVVFLCFGTRGVFEPEQVAEIAHALEHSGHRFLWALRRPPTKDNIKPLSESECFDDMLPEGFLERTKEIGKVIGWAPQVAVLSHQAVGGFVSHCGWNSILESLWCGIPIATWPLYAEQQMNAFMLVKELGLAVEITLYYQQDNPKTLTAKEIAGGIKQLMEGTESTKIRSKVNAMRCEIQKAGVMGGSSYVVMGHFIEKVLNGSP